MNLKEKKVLVAGAGKSGMGAADLLVSAGAKVTLWDENDQLDSKKVKEQMKDPAGAEVVIGSMDEKTIELFDLMVLSPGISVDTPVPQAFSQMGKPVWSEIELAYQVSQGRIAAVTGTNGKTTTTALIGEIFRGFFKDVYVVGNIGIPYTSIALHTTKDSVIAAEISSFQLETIVDFCPDVSAVLNLTPDHLDRHKTVENYGRVKESISKNQEKDQYMVLNYDDPVTKAMAERTKATVIFFSLNHMLKNGVCLYEDHFQIVENGDAQTVCSTKDSCLLGGHNYENILAAIAVSYYMGVPIPQIKKGIQLFQGVAHRIEYVDTVRGVAYYNDSKGTNVDAAIKGIQAMNRPTFLIGGGYDKKSTYDEWIQSFDGKVKRLILLGQTAVKIGETARKHGFDQIVYVDDLKEAVTYAAKHAVEGEAVLLSPACASWGMFPNYEVRGDCFKEYVKELKE